jgi:hypothetical protein
MSVLRGKTHDRRVRYRPTAGVRGGAVRPGLLCPVVGRQHPRGQALACGSGAWQALAPRALAVPGCGALEVHRVSWVFGSRCTAPEVPWGLRTRASGSAPPLCAPAARRCAQRAVLLPQLSMRHTPNPGQIADALARDVHYTVDEKQKSVLLTEEGYEAVEDVLQVQYRRVARAKRGGVLQEGHCECLWVVAAGAAVPQVDCNTTSNCHSVTICGACANSARACVG